MPKEVIILDPIGKVIHYYDKLGVAIIDLQRGSLKVGDQVKFQQGNHEFIQTVNSLQIEHEQVDEVNAGDQFGLKVDQPVKEGTLVYLV